MNLVIVESPTKARTLSRFLGKEYEMLASMGHVRDLPKKKISVDIEHDFAPVYEPIPGKVKIISELTKACKKAAKVILATDPDREGEAIAWHVAYILGGKKGARDLSSESSKFVRITFHEITKSAIEEALKNPGSINLQLVEAQQARRILDRLVGYKLSPLLWSKVRRGLSAGRVQSVALRFIVEREKEIGKFAKKEFWTIETELIAKGAENNSFLAALFAKNGEKYENTACIELFAGPYKYQSSTIRNQNEAEAIGQDLKKQLFKIESIEEKEVRREPGPAFITSTLQQSANTAFGFSAKKTMMVAQRLYEEGYITYHRTDSFNLAGSALESIRKFIKNQFGEKYLSEKTRFFKTKSKVAQEAHEAIRPTDFGRQTAELEKTLGKDEARLYDLIFKKACATQMAAARLCQTAVEVKAGPYNLRATGVRNLFDGFLRLYPSRLKEKILPKLEKGQTLDLRQVLPKQNFTSPPPRYNEASLVKILEAKGIGRPSTYAPIITLIQARGYVEKKEGVFWPTAVGNAVIKFLTATFADIVDIPFTAAMEEDLDAIARGEKERVPVLKAFYSPFAKKLDDVAKNGQRVKIEVEKTGQKCPKCKKGDVVIRTGRFGKFLSCSRFPDCDWKGTYQEKVANVKCPECGSDVVLRRTRKGKYFYGCSRWPACKWASWRKPTIGTKPN